MVVPDQLVIDDFAVFAMDASQAKLAFQGISDRYDYRRFIAITTNRLFKDWTQVVADPLNARTLGSLPRQRSARHHGASRRIGCAVAESQRLFELAPTLWPWQKRLG
jgi:DNA replication protein DnaC